MAARGPRLARPSSSTSFSVILRAFVGVMVSMICPSVNASPCQRKWEARSMGAFVVREPTMNLRSASCSAREVGRRQHARVGDHDHVGDAVTGLRTARRSGAMVLRLGFVALETAWTISGNPSRVGQQPDGDLRLQDGVPWNYADVGITPITPRSRLCRVRRLCDCVRAVQLAWRGWPARHNRCGADPGVPVWWCSRWPIRRRNTWTR